MNKTAPTNEELVEWVEPFGPNSEPVFCRVTKQTAIAYTKNVHPDHKYESDEQALEDFMVVHWAVPVPAELEAETRPTESGGRQGKGTQDRDIPAPVAPASPPTLSAEARDCRSVPRGNGFCDRCAVGDYEHCRYTTPLSAEAREEYPDFELWEEAQITAPLVRFSYSPALGKMFSFAGGEYVRFEQAAALITRLSQRNAGLERDAERYRYWRDNHGWTGYFDDGASNDEENDKVDAAIDAAMSKEPPHG